jgi:hypothetical protein
VLSGAPHQIARVGHGTDLCGHVSHDAGHSPCDHDATGGAGWNELLRDEHGCELRGPEREPCSRSPHRRRRHGYGDNPECTNSHPTAPALIVVRNINTVSGGQEEGTESFFGLASRPLKAHCDDLALIEHPAPNVEPGDMVVIPDGREALVTARVGTCGSGRSVRCSRWRSRRRR